MLAHTIHPVPRYFSPRIRNMIVVGLGGVGEGKIVQHQRHKSLFGCNGSVPFSHTNDPFPSVSKRREGDFQSRNGRPTERNHCTQTGSKWYGESVIPLPTVYSHDNPPACYMVDNSVAILLVGHWVRDGEV